MAGGACNARTTFQKPNLFDGLYISFSSWNAIGLDNLLPSDLFSERPPQLSNPFRGAVSPYYYPCYTICHYIRWNNYFNWLIQTTLYRGIRASKFRPWPVHDTRCFDANFINGSSFKSPQQRELGLSPRQSSLPFRLSSLKATLPLPRLHGASSVVLVAFGVFQFPQQNSTTGLNRYLIKSSTAKPAAC